MGSVVVEVIDIVGEHGFQIAAAEDQRLVEALASQGADDPLTDRVRLGCPDRCFDDPGSIPAP